MRFTLGLRRPILVALAAVFFAAGSNAGATAETDSTAPSLVIVRAHKPEFRSDLQVVTPNDPTAFFFGGVYESNFTIIRTLAGPDLGKELSIQFAGSHIDHWRDFTLLMVVTRDADGGLWGGQSWERITSQACLSAEDIRSWSLEATFARAQTDGDGRRCLEIR